MKKILLLFSTLILASGIQAQTLTLANCQTLARDNHPQLKQAGIIQELYALKVKSIGASNLPQIDLSGRATYQSDVTQLNLQIPGMTSTEFAKDQYKIYLDIKQKIYDFGISKNKKELEVADRNINLQQNAVELYKIKETVNNLYFTILALQQNNDILSLKRQNIDERLRIVKSGVKNGMLLANELDNLLAEGVMTEQQQVELSMSKQTALALLGIIIGHDLSENALLANPSPEEVFPTQEPSKRPEEMLFELQKYKLEKSDRLLKSTRLPYVYGFGQAGYGRPGLNMLKNDFDDWYMVGLGLSWNLWDGNKTKNDRAALSVQKKTIDIAKESFDRSIQLAITQEVNNIRKIEILLIADQQLVELREKIAKRSASALDNGTITSADYIRDLNAALQAKASYNIHNLQLIQAKVNYHTILGN